MAPFWLTAIRLETKYGSSSIQYRLFGIFSAICMPFWRMNRKVRLFFRRMRNVFRYLPIIWEDSDWDGWFCYNILQTKLKHMADYYERTGARKASKYCAQASLACSRLKDEPYTQYVDNVYHRYRERVLRRKGKNPDNFDHYFNTARTPKEKLIENKIREYADIKRRQGRSEDLKTLMRFFNRHIENCWD